MKRRITALAPSIFLAAFFIVWPLAAQDEALKKDLTAVIALHGLPCGEVVSVKVQAENDFAVTCKDEHKYRVYLNAKGRVIVEKK
jgi:hypothetical protein